MIRRTAPAPALLEHLRVHASGYFPEIDRLPVEVRLEQCWRRTNADLYRLSLSDGRRSRQVIVKARKSQPPAPGEPEPLVPSVRQERKLAYEHSALSAIEGHFRALADPRFGWVRVLDLVSAHDAFVVEAAPGGDLGSALARAFRSRSPGMPEALLAGVRNSGGWLRAYHDLDPLPHTEAQPDTRDAFLARLHGLLQGVALDPALRFDAAELEGRLGAYAAEALPEVLPTGTGHGDYSPGNVLADAAGRVCVVDTFANWSGPVCYDLSHYLFALKAPKDRLYATASRRWPAALGRVEQAFLEGYFDADTVPIAAIRLFEIQHLLYRWSRAARAARDPGFRGWGKRARLVVKTRFFGALLDRLLADLVPLAGAGLQGRIGS